MKKFMAIFALFSALIFVISCGGGSKSVNHGDEPDTGETVTDGDTTDSEPADKDPSDSGHENPDTTPEQPDNGDTAPDGGDTTPDGSDTTPDNGDTEPDNDYPQTPCDPNPCISDANSTGACTIKNNSYVCGCKSGYIFDGTLCIKSLPECSPESATPCIDSATGLIWSAKSENKMPWNDAVNYCQNLTEGDFNDWRLPSIAVLKTLVQNCFSAKCADDYTGKYSKFGDTVYLWSSSENEDSTAQSIYFSNAGTQSVSIDDNVNVRCVRRETESRQSNCTGLIANAVWNTVSQITQTWDWETAVWTPSSEGSYNTAGSSSVCRFKCDSNSFWEGSSEKCSNPCKPNPCYSNGTTSICVGKSANEYTCECQDNYFWDGSSKQCLNPCEPNPCNTIGETGICLSKSKNEYICECENNYVWTPYYECIKNLCHENSCDIPNSTGTCNPISGTKYACECKENYYWWGTEKGCIDKGLALGSICTGQTSCYKSSSLMMTCSAAAADYYGEDAQYAALGVCTPQSFTAASNVVVDNNTGLTWEKSPSSTTYTWADRNIHCNELNNLNYGGKSNWRVPNPLELLTIVDNSKYNPATNSNFSMPTGNDVYLWTNNEFHGATSSAYIFSVYYGSYSCYAGSNLASKTYRYKVLCVSGEEMKPAVSSDFTISSDGETVTDNRTGLMWSISFEASEVSWDYALQSCENSTYAGYSDWRLPNKNELASLVNYEKPESPYSYCPGTFSSTVTSHSIYISSSLSVGSTISNWSVDFGNGSVSHTQPYSSKIRCVRNAE